jgi:hypothetical protein
MILSKTSPRIEMLVDCKQWQHREFRDVYYEGFSLLACDVVKIFTIVSEQPAASFCPQYGGIRFLRNVGKYLL